MAGKIDDHFISSDHQAGVWNLTHVMTCETTIPRKNSFFLENSTKSLYEANIFGSLFSQPCSCHFCNKKKEKTQNWSFESQNWSHLRYTPTMSTKISRTREIRGAGHCWRKSGSALPVIVDHWFMQIWTSAINQSLGLRTVCVKLKCRWNDYRTIKFGHRILSSLRAYPHTFVYRSMRKIFCVFHKCFRCQCAQSIIKFNIR